MTNITTAQFEKQLREQNDAINALKWRELQIGQIYTIVSVEFLTTQYGGACILTLSDGQRVYSPSSLTKRLKQEKQKPFPRYVRSTGRIQSKRNPTQTYYAFDLV